MRNTLSPLPAILIAGLLGEIAFELYAWVLNPPLFGFTLEPAFLVRTLAELWLGVSLGYPAAFALHALAGAVVFPLAYLAFLRVSPVSSAWINGVIWGVVLWIIAQGILAPLAGRPVFMGFVPYTWASLLAHPLYMLVVALAYDWFVRGQRPAADTPVPQTAQ